MKEDTQSKIGKIFTEAERDAIHIAVLPAIANLSLLAGEKVNYEDGHAFLSNVGIGIVDPFLPVVYGPENKYSVKKGDKFFIFLYPNTITTLRHQWTHPLIPDEVMTRIKDKVASEAWLRAWTASADCPGYDAVIAAALDNDGDEYLHFNGSDAHGEIPDEFWNHLEVVTGKKFPQERRATYFSCSC